MKHKKSEPRETWLRQRMKWNCRRNWATSKWELEYDLKVLVEEIAIEKHSIFESLSALLKQILRDSHFSFFTSSCAISWVPVEFYLVLSINWNPDSYLYEHIGIEKLELLVWELELQVINFHWDFCCDFFGFFYVELMASTAVFRFGKTRSIFPKKLFKKKYEHSAIASENNFQFKFPLKLRNLKPPHG